MTRKQRRVEKELSDGINLWARQGWKLCWINKEKWEDYEEVAASIFSFIKQYLSKV